MKLQTYIALFRGINVGGRNILPMKDLVVLLEDSGYQNVRTYIQSGNVVFESPCSLAESPYFNIGELVAQNYGFKPEVIFLSTSNVLSADKNCPYLSAEGKTVHFYFCSSTLTLNEDKIEKMKAASEEYFIKDNVFYLHAPDGIGRSKLVANIETCLGTSATGRNLNTVNRLIEMIKIN